MEVTRKAKYDPENRLRHGFNIPPARKNTILLHQED